MNSSKDDRVRGNVADRKIGPSPGQLVATMADLVRLYVGPSSLLMATDQSLVCLLYSGLAYSFDNTIGKYRFSLQRPMCEGKPRFVEKLRGFHRTIGKDIGLGFAFNSTPEAHKNLERRGIWLPNCTSLEEGISIPSAGAIVDVVSGICDVPQFWPDPPMSQQAEY